jgi:hypothetical protein
MFVGMHCFFAGVPLVSSTAGVDGAQHDLPHRVRIEKFCKFKCLWHVWEE